MLLSSLNHRDEILFLISSYYTLIYIMISFLIGIIIKLYRKSNESFNEYWLSEPQSLIIEPSFMSNYLDNEERQSLI